MNRLMLTALLVAALATGCVGLEAQKLLDTARGWSCQRLKQPETKMMFDAAWKQIGDQAYEGVKEAVCGE